MSESPVTIPMPRPSPRPASECDPNCTLQTALELIVRIYHRYSSSVNRNDTLNQQELKLFLNREAPTFLEACVSGMGQRAGAWPQGSGSCLKCCQPCYNGL